jgi:ribosomal-protein-alanine N-acetyltransferase
MNRFLTTERLRIRPITTEDSAFILELLNTPSWLRFIGDRHVYTESNAKQYIIDLQKKSGYYYNLILLQSTNAPIGVISFLHRDQLPHPDLGFALLPTYEGKGYAYEAVRRYLDELILEETVDKIIAITQADNVHAIRLLKKMEMRFEQMIDHQEVSLACYALTLKK